MTKEPLLHKCTSTPKHFHHLLLVPMVATSLLISSTSCCRSCGMQKVQKDSGTLWTIITHLMLRNVAALQHAKNTKRFWNAFDHSYSFGAKVMTLIERAHTKTCAKGPYQNLDENLDDDHSALQQCCCLQKANTFDRHYPALFEAMVWVVGPYESP